MLYGRQIFHLCLSTCWWAIDLVDRARLAGKILYRTTNDIRKSAICSKSETLTPAEKLVAI